MTALATENFNRADSTGLSSANWTTANSCTSFNIASNTGAVLFNTFGGNYYNAVVWPNAQYGQVVLASPLATSADEGVGPVVRLASGAFTGYWVQAGAGDTRLYKIVGGTFTQLGSTDTASSIGDVIKLVANGTSITATRNGTAICGTPVTDASISSGNVGIFGSSSGPNAALDSFEGGDLNVAITSQSLEQPNRPRPGRGPFSKGRFYVSDTTAYTSSANIIAGLTGASATFASGSMVPSASLALTGRSASATPGTVVPGIAKALTGTSATHAAGTPVAGLSASLAGQPLAAASGALSSGIAHALTGQSATVTAGTVTTGSDVTASLTGQSVATTAGAVFAASQISVSGQSSATSAGTMAYSASLALLGQSGAFAAGTLPQSHAVGVTGQGATFTSGVVSPPGGVTLSLTGQAAGFTAGSVSVSSATALTGQAATASNGSLIAGHTSALSGSALTSSSGTLLGSFALTLSGQSTTFGSGLVLPPGDKSAALTGQLATFRSGVIVPIGAVLIGNPHYIVQRPRKRDFTVSACTFRNFPPKDPAESIPLTFDFEVDLAPGITLSGTPVVTVTVNSGSDPAPTTILNGLPRFDITSTEVIVPVLGGITNCDYDIKVVVNTTDSLTILALSGVLPVRA